MGKIMVPSLPQQRREEYERHIREMEEELLQQELELRERERRQSEEEERRKADAEQKRNSSVLQSTSLTEFDYSLYHSSYQPQFLFPLRVRDGSCMFTQWVLLLQLGAATLVWF